MQNERPLEGCQILLVEDEPQILGLLQRAFSRAGAVVHGAGSLAAADSILRGLRPELVVTDLNLGDGDGLDMVREVRGRDWSSDVGIIVLSGAVDLNVHIDALNCGADDFVSKPVMTRVMLSRAANLVGLRRAERRARTLAARLSRYVSAPVLDRQDYGVRNRSPENLSATVLFTDLRGFTATLHDREPMDVFQALRAIHATQTRLVHAEGGYIDKFTGDGLLAIFEGEESEARACATAVSILAWAREHEGFGPFRPVPIGIGLHVGALLRGEFGDDERSELTVIGDVVNQAARICGVAGPLEALVTTEVLRAAGPAFASLGTRTASLKGLGLVDVHVLGSVQPS